MASWETMLRYFADIFCRQHDFKPPRAVRLSRPHELQVHGCYTNIAYYPVDDPVNLDPAWD